MRSWIYSQICVFLAKIFPAPIVPLTEENETAMEDDVFTNFLHTIGFSPPASEQVSKTNIVFTEPSNDTCAFQYA
jgi:hypothetical protein